MSAVAEPPVHARSIDPPLSAGHGVSLSTTSGITSVITGVMAAALAAQVPAAADARVGLLAGGAIAALTVGAVGLYEARNAVGAAMDLAPVDPARAAALAARSLAAYHLGMAGVLAGLALAAAWRVALPLGGLAWVAPAAAGLAALAAVVRAAGWCGVWRRRMGA